MRLSSLVTFWYNLYSLQLILSFTFTFVSEHLEQPEYQTKITIIIKLTFVPHFTWIKWNELSGWHYFLRFFTNTINCTVSLGMQVSFRKLEIWLVNAGHMKAKSDCKPDSFDQMFLVWAYSLVQQKKADKYPSCYLF